MEVPTSPTHTHTFPLLWCLSITGPQTWNEPVMAIQTEAPRGGRPHNNHHSPLLKSHQIQSTVQTERQSWIMLCNGGCHVHSWAGQTLRHNLSSPPKPLPRCPPPFLFSSFYLIPSSGKLFDNNVQIAWKPLTSSVQTRLQMNNIHALSLPFMLCLTIRLAGEENSLVKDEAAWIHQRSVWS